MIHAIWLTKKTAAPHYKVLVNFDNILYFERKIGSNYTTVYLKGGSRLNTWDTVQDIEKSILE